MKKCFRGISMLVLFTFLFNGVVLDTSESFGIGETSTLSPVLKFSGLARIEPKEMSKVEFVLETALLEYADGESVVDLEAMQEAVNEDYAYTSVFDDTHPFFAEREVLPDGRILVMTRVLRDRDEKILRTYYAVFSTKKIDGGFDVRAYTEKEWKENEEIIRRGGDLPKRESQKPEDARAIARYKNDNERVIDTFIRERIYKDDFAEIKGRAIALWGKARKWTRAPKVEFPAKYLEFINERLNGFLGNFGTNVKEALDGKNLVFIRVPKDTAYPVIYEKDPDSGEMVPIPVRSHTSQHAVYIFLDNYTFDSLKDPDVRWDRVINGEVLPRLLYEIGVIYDLPYRLVAGMGIWGTMNDLLNAYNTHRLGATMRETKKYFPNLKLTQKVNLNETLWTRDYFMASQDAGNNLDFLAEIVAKELYRTGDAENKEKQELISSEIERRLVLYSLKAIMWNLMEQNDVLTNSKQLDSILIKYGFDWESYASISSSIDTLLCKKVIEWINARASTGGSVLHKEIDSLSIVSKIKGGWKTLQISRDQENALVKSVLYPTFGELFGRSDEKTGLLKEKHCSDKIETYLLKEKSRQTRDSATHKKLGYVQSEDNVEALAKAIAEEFYKEPDEKKQGQILLEVERLLTIYSLKAIMWHLMAQNQLTSSEQLDIVETGREKLWVQYTTIPSSLDTFLREKIIEWINVQAQTKGSALRNEIKAARIVSQSPRVTSYLRVATAQEREITDSILKPTMKELFGHSDPTDFIGTEDFSNKINNYLGEVEKTDKGPYWYAVEEDLRRAIDEGRVVKITKDYRVVKVKKVYEDLPAGVHPAQAQTPYDDLVETIKKTKKILNLWNEENWIAKSIDNSKVKKWVEKRYKSMIEDDTHVDQADKIVLKLKNSVKKWTEGAEDMEVFIVLDSAYVSPRTKEFVHVGRKGNRIFLPELFLKEVKRAVEEEDNAEVKESMPILFVDENQHVGKAGASHGTIKTEDDIDNVVDHIFKGEYDEFPRREVRAAWEKSMEGKMPWEPLLKGKTVGKSPEFVKFYEDLKEFADNDMKRTALVYGDDGHGKTKTIEAVQERMNVGEEEVVKIDCKLVKDFTPDEIYEIVFKNWEKKKLLVLDNFNKLEIATPLTKMLLYILENVRKGESQLYLGREKPIDITNLKMLCVAGVAYDEGLMFGSYTLDACLQKLKIWDKFQETMPLPNLMDREDDILRMAEYFNFEACKLRKIDYAPMDESVGYVMQEIIAKNMAVTIWDIKDLIEAIVANRSKGECYSDYLITFVDITVLYKSTQRALLKLKDLLWRFKEEEEAKKFYDKLQKFLPYFKEFVEKDKMGNPIGFYKGARGEQPGLPRGGRGFPSYPKHTGLFKKSAQSVEKNDQHKKKIKTLKEYANIVGKLIAPPVSNYTLFTAYDLATDKEYDEDIKEYGSRFKLERISTDKPEDIVEKVLDVIKDKGLKGENIIVQLPEEFAQNRYNLDELLSAAPGIKFMVIDTKGLKEEDSEEDRKQYRNIIYNMMRLARNIDKNADSMVSSLLNYFVDYCFDNTMDSAMREASITIYLDAISHNRILEMLNTVLSYKYMTKHTLPDKALIVKPLVSA